MLQKRILCEFNRSIGCFIYRSNLILGAQIRPSFWELYHNLIQETAINFIFDLWIPIPRSRFQIIYPKATQYFDQIYYIDPTDLFLDIPGHSIHPYLHPSEFGCDYLLSSRSPEFKKYSYILDPDQTNSFLSLPHYFPEASLSPTNFEYRIFSSEEFKEDYEERKRKETQWNIEVYLELTHGMESNQT